MRLTGIGALASMLSVLRNEATSLPPPTHSRSFPAPSQFNGISGKEKHARRELHTHVDINPCRKGPHIRESKGSSLRWKTQPTLLLLIQIFHRQVFLFVPPNV